MMMSIDIVLERLRPFPLFFSKAPASEVEDFWGNWALVRGTYSKLVGY